ncbi:MAG: Crp/Fnr family transcriptional regulator [Anaerolineae bacterium]|nr:Crp/Fnr family transcriptional regulator [Anaerolineae bacterium]
MTVTAQTLSNISFFAGLDDATLQDIAHHAYERAFQSDQMIVLQGDPCEGVYWIVRGRVWLRRFSPGGREYVFEHLGPGQFFNLVPALDGGTCLASVDALADTTVCIIPCDIVSQLAQKHRDITAIVLVHLAARVRRLTNTVEGLALYPVRARLARFLLANVTNPESARQWTQERVASHIGTVRDVVGRTLRTLAQDGLIRREQGRLVVTDLDGLRQEAMRE